MQRTIPILPSCSPNFPIYRAARGFFISLPFILIARWRPRSAPCIPRRLCTALLNDFFRDPNNCAPQPEACVFSVVGQPDDCDDWDWGRLVYDWRTPEIAVRAIVQGGHVMGVERLDPADMERFAQPIEVRWQRPANTPDE